jgi:lysylphosphatidylglycerol synthetase-like protein (DUF2156 family)
MKNLLIVIILTLVIAMLTVSSIATSVFCFVISASLVSNKLGPSVGASLPHSMIPFDTDTTIKDILLFII